MKIGQAQVSQEQGQPWKGWLCGHADFSSWQAEQRRALCDTLGIPSVGAPLLAENRGTVHHHDLTIEKWIYTAEPGSRVPCVLWRPTQFAGKLPAVVLTYGHGGSKSQPDYVYPAMLFAKLGFAVLAIDPIGEEERHLTGGMGTRAHDPEPVHNHACNAGRLIMGKLCFDTMRGIDFLLERNDIDPSRIGVAGNSLGGATAGWMATLETRLAFAVISGWAFAPMLEIYGKFCTRVPNQRMRERLAWEQYLSLAAPHCALRIVNGDADVIIDADGRGNTWRDMNAIVATVAEIYAALGRPNAIQTWYEKGGGHRPYQARKQNVQWLVELMNPAGCTPERARSLNEINFGDWCRVYGYELESLYGNSLHLQGATVVDLDIMPLKREQLAVLRPDEIGRDEFSIEGWLKMIGD